MNRTSSNLTLNPPRGVDQPKHLTFEVFVHGRSHPDGSEQPLPCQPSRFCSWDGGGGQTIHSSTSNLKWTQNFDLAAEQMSSVVFLTSPWHTQCHLRRQLAPLHYQLQSPLTYRSIENKGMHWMGATISS